MLKSPFFEEFAVLDLNMTGFSEVVQRSHTGGSLIPYMWDQRAEKIFFSYGIFSHFLTLNPTDFFDLGRGTDDCYSCYILEICQLNFATYDMKRKKWLIGPTSPLCVKMSKLVSWK